MQQLSTTFLGLCLWLLFAFTATAQGVVKGRVSDAKTNEPIPFASVSTKDGARLVGVQTDFDGLYTLSLPAGSYTVSYSNVGCPPQTRQVTIVSGQEISIDVALEAQPTMLDVVVKSASKFEQKVSEQTVSLEVLKPNLVDGINSTSIDKAIEKTPGVDVIDGQANIRGGSGYSYGAGSRVLLLMDDMPIMNGDAGYPDWDFLPVENLEQVEIIKGASSALYGSSALNGIINFRTAFPKSEPEIKFSVFGTLYQKPAGNEVIKYSAEDTLFQNPLDTAYKAWWQDSTMIYEAGGSFGYKKKFGQFDLVTGGYLFSSNSWRKDQYSRRGRINANMRYRFKNKPGMSVGLNLNTQLQESGSFLIWNNLAGGINGDSSIAYITKEGVDEGAYKLWTATPPINNNSFAISIDPYWEFFNTGNGTKHKVQGRFYRNDNQNDTNQSTASDLFYGEYQFQKRFNAIKLVLTTGLTANYVISDAELFQGTTKNASNQAAYLQLDKKFFNKLNVSLGARYERNTVEDVSEAKPVFRAGVNYELGKYTFLRASWGQGYRFPTIAEKYIRTDLGAYRVGGVPVELGIFPNDSLLSETGQSAEIGIKQGLRIGEWEGFFDVTGFFNEYNNMMEFTFGINDNVRTILSFLPASVLGEDLYRFLNDSCVYEANVTIPNDSELRAGFQSVNIGDTRIFGADMVLGGRGKLGSLPTTVMLGYTFINPKFQLYDCIQQALTSYDGNLLKYRFQHTVKGDIETTIKKFSVGLTMQYYSHMKAIDQAFNVLLPGIKDFRDYHNSGELILDFRAGVKLGNSTISFLVKNLFNREYAIRPALIDAPRSFTVKYGWAIKGKAKDDK